jgi:hypothetical protein
LIITMPQAKQQILDKEGTVINAGDTVTTAARSRKHRGVVDAVVITAEDAAEHGVNNPPKIIFDDEAGMFESIRGSVEHGLTLDPAGNRFVQNPKALLVEKKAE